MLKWRLILYKWHYKALMIKVSLICDYLYYRNVNVYDKVIQLYKNNVKFLLREIVLQISNLTIEEILAIYEKQNLVEIM